MTIVVAVAVLLALAFSGAWLGRRRGWWQRDWHWDVAAVAILALLVVACFWRAFVVADYWLPEGGGDNASTLLPFYRFAAEELRAGRLPLWNPYLYGGAPFAADLQTAVFYPVNWLAFLLSSEITYQTITILLLGHVALAGVGVYALGVFGRLDGVGPVGRPAALVGAIAFMLCDYVIVHLGNLNLVAGAAWLPWATLALARGLDGRRLGPMLLSGMALALAVLAGHIQPFLYGMLFAGGLTVFGIVRCWQADGWRAAILLGARAAAVPIVAVGVVAAQLAPSQELRALTGRADIGYDASIAYSLPPAQLLSLLVPDLFGRGPGSYWGPWPRVEMGYFGVLPLVAAVGALVVQRRALVWLLAGAGVVAIILAMGGYTVVHGWVYRFVPGFEGIRAPARAIVIFNLAMAWLAAIGVDTAMKATDPLLRQTIGRFVRWGGFALLGLVVGALPPFVFFLALAQGQRGPVPLRLTAILDGLLLFALLLGGALALLGLRAHGRLTARAFGALAVIWVAFDLLSIGFDVDGGSVDPLANYRHPGVVAFLRQDPDQAFRIDTETGVWKHWQPASGLYHRVADVRGVDNPLMLADTQRYWADLGGRNGAPYDLLNVRYVLGPPEAVFEPTKFERVLADGPVVVYRNRNALPRVWLAPDAEIAPNRDAAFAAVHRAGFDPRRTVVLEQGPAQRGGAGEVVIVDRQSDQLTVRVRAPQGGYLVLSETWYPGWQVSVNDQPPQPTLRANYLFQAVWAPPGESTIRIRYAPTLVYAGLVISGLTLIVAIGAVVTLAVRDRRALTVAPAPTDARRQRIDSAPSLRHG